MEGARCLAEFSRRGGEPRVCNLRAGHDEPHAGYPARSTHGKLLAELRDARGAVSIDAAVDALTDALVDYDVPTGRIVGEFKRLVAAYSVARGRS